MPCSRVVVGSRSPIKLKAVEEAFTLLGDIEVVGVGAESGVNDQPVGHEETRRGASNRLQESMKAVPGAAYYVSMENGIIELAPDEWYDLAWVFVHCTESGRTSSIPTTGLPFPLKYVQGSAASNYTKTAGFLMSADKFTASSTDPHTSLTKGLLSRASILTQGIAAALGVVREA